MATATAAMAITSAGTLTAAGASSRCCPKCGYGVDLPPLDETQASLLKAQRQIADLQAQVSLLNQKATAAVDRLADYEDELAKLRAQLDARPQTPTPPSLQPAARQQQHQPAALPTPPGSAAGPPSPSPSSRASFLTTSAASRISALLSRKSPPAVPAPAALAPAPSPIPSLPSSLASYGNHPAIPPTFPSTSAPTSTSPSGGQRGGGSDQGDQDDHDQQQQQQQQPRASTAELLGLLAREQALRREAEGRLRETSREVEELSASLFEQANEMVAAERRARARLEARVGELERREADKRARLEALERAVGRIGRVRGLLADNAGPDSGSDFEAGPGAGAAATVRAEGREGEGEEKERGPGRGGGTGGE